MAILTKQKFCKVIERLEQANKLVDDVNKLFQQSRETLELDFHNAAAMSINHEGLVLSLLEEIFDDKGEYISYFLYELEYGDKYESGSITEKDGKCIRLTTPEDLYDFLVGNPVYE